MMNQKDAEKLAEKYNQEGEGVDIGMCPLLNGYCNTNCVCYREAEAIMTGIDKGVTNYQVFKPRCGNAMFSGERK